MSGHPNKPRVTMDDYRFHFEECPRCSMFSPCTAGAAILEAAIDTTAESLAPVPMMAKGQA